MMYRSKRRQKKLEEKRRRRTERIKEIKKQKRESLITTVGYITIKGEKDVLTP